MTQIQIRRGTSTQWTAANTVLAQGEFGYETNTGKLKVGDGTSTWNSLSYFPVEWSALTGKPTYIAAGSTANAAAAAINLGNVDNTSDATKWAAAAALTNKDLTSATNTFPTSLVTLTGTQTLTSKTLTSPVINSATGSFSGRITPRIGTTTSSATPSINTDLYDQYNITALGVAITSVTVTGTPVDGQKLLIRIKDDGTGRAITWGSSFSSSGSSTLLSTTVATKTHLSGFIYDAVAAKWVCVAVDSMGY